MHSIACRKFKWPWYRCPKVNIVMGISLKVNYAMISLLHASEYYTLWLHPDHFTELVFIPPFLECLLPFRKQAFYTFFAYVDGIRTTKTCINFHRWLSQRYCPWICNFMNGFFLIYYSSIIQPLCHIYTITQILRTESGIDETSSQIRCYASRTSDSRGRCGYNAKENVLE